MPSKLEPIAADESYVVRERVLTQFTPLRPLTLVSAMPGSGKSVAVRHWIDRLDQPVAWVNVDALDEEPVLFWTHLLGAVMLVCPEVDDEPMVLLRERGPDDRMFLVALINRLEQATEPALVVLDGSVHRLARSVIDGLALLVDRAHARLRLVITAQVDPPLPVGRWRPMGWVTEVRGDVLRMTDDEAVAVARRLGVADLDDTAIVELNHVVDGWPLAVRLALGSGMTLALDERRGGAWPEAERSVAAQLAAQLLATLDEQECDVALGLSVLDELDPAMCLELFGDGASPAIRSLLRHSSLLAVVDHHTGAMRFHPLIRRLLESELGWRDPVRRLELHRAAATMFQAKGDIRAAYRHLAAIGEVGRARALLVDAAVDVVDRGDLVSLQTLAAQLPAVGQVDRIELALELGLIAAWGDGTEAAQRWCSRAAQLVDDLAPGSASRSELDLRVRQLECTIAMFDCDLETAVALVATLPRPTPHTRTQLDTHMAFVATRALIAARHPSARDWVERVATFEGPPIVADVTIPALRAWNAWLEGDLDLATQLSERAVAWLDEHHVDAHHWAIDALITAGWCRLTRGDVAGTRHLTERAEAVASAIPCRWNRAQAAYLAGSLALAVGDAAGALRIADETRLATLLAPTGGYAGRLVHLAAEAAIVLGRLDLAATLAEQLPPGSARQLLRSRFAQLSDAQVATVLAERSTWPALHRLRADAILATRARGTTPSPELVELLTACGESGWVLPFLHLGRRAERTLRTAPLDLLHPQLLAAIDVATGTRDDDRADDGPRLTPRELSLLELLPTHLSYAEMGERMYLSVNTVKASLKGLYRKLDAHTRAQAVAAGQSHGLI
ncbi:MAG TPA: LuxR C-terminal-related transcriptional regulator [Ilumatobacter sp.]|nr:LuxR C-terminal-related transcriptional regulator [Ilumatobacter sp.]